MVPKESVESHSVSAIDKGRIPGSSLVFIQCHLLVLVLLLSNLICKHRPFEFAGGLPLLFEPDQILLLRSPTDIHVQPLQFHVLDADARRDALVLLGPFEVGAFVADGLSSGRIPVGEQPDSLMWIQVTKRSFKVLHFDTRTPKRFG